MENHDNKFICKGCEKEYKNDKSLLTHHKRSKLCIDWIEILKNNSSLSKQIQKIHSSENDKKEVELICFGCNYTFSNLGNLNKHLRNRRICRKTKDWLIYHNDKEEEVPKDEVEVEVEEEEEEKDIKSDDIVVEHVIRPRLRKFRKFRKSKKV